MESRQEKRVNSFYYANGMGVKQCRQICKFWFGEFFFQAIMNKHLQQVEIYLYTKIRDKKTGGWIMLEDQNEGVDVKYFDDYWCKETKQWVIKKISPEDTIDVDLE